MQQVNELECWRYKGVCLYEPPEGYYGFIYKITDPNGYVYFGKKAFTHSHKKALTKKERVGTRKRVKIVVVDSGWIEYWGSCIPINQDIKENGTTGYRREIIKLCEDKTSWTYWEGYVLFTENVLFRDDCWNGNIFGKFYKGKVK